MVKGIKLTQHVFKDDDTDMTIADADDLFGAFLDTCVARGFHAGGEVRLVDDEGAILKGGFRNVAESMLQPPKPPRRPSPYEWAYRGRAVEELSGDEAREALRNIIGAAEA